MNEPIPKEMSDASAGQPGPLTVDRYCGVSDERRQAEAAILDRGHIFPLSGRVAWLEAFPDQQSCLFVVRDHAGTPIGGVAVEHVRSRALPGHWIWLVGRVDPSSREVVTVALDAVIRAARADRTVLRVHFDIFSREPALRAQLTPLLMERSLKKLESPRGHQWTLVIDLANGAEPAWRALKGSVRRDIRIPERAPLEVRVVDDPALVPRMEALVAETYARTGGTAEESDFAGIMRLSRAEPGASRIFGLFRTDITGPDALVSFAWGCRHGSHMCYHVGASTRDPAVRRHPLAHAPLWALVNWAGAEGAKWFDLGGVTFGSKGSDDPLAGISDFKRSFTQDVVEVREEWQFEPHPMRARLARTLSNGATLAKRLRARLR
jgi:hypothetical protein